MKIVAFTPIRQGSKGVPNKSLLSLLGTPLFAYGISQLCLIKDISNIYIATDGNHIKKEICNYFPTIDTLKVISRPAYTCEDTSSSESVLLYFAEKYFFDVCIFFQITNVFFTDTHIREALELYFKTQKDIISVAKSTKFFFHDKYCNYDIYSRPRRQDIEIPTYIENGAFYISSRKNILKTKNRVSKPIQLYEMPEHTCFEIDTLLDVEIVKSILSFMQK